MEFIGFNLIKVHGERKKEISGKVEVKTNIKIIDIKKESIEMIKGREVLSFEFEFAINYNPEIAKILFEGEVILAMDSKEAKEILNKWKKKEMDSNVRVNLFNLILSKCTIKSLSLEEEMSLVPHLPLRFVPSENIKKE